MADESPGYTDTPELPHCDYRVHDAERPRPPVVDPGDPVGSRDPPSDATVLFDGTDLRNWESTHGGDADWIVRDDYVEVDPGADGIRTVSDIGDCQLHVEWRAPAEIDGSGQERGNSGIFLLDRYEIQVLDSFENPTYADGYTGAVYGQHPPSVNASRPPGEWQTFEILWHGPRFDGETVTRPARVSLLHNGVLVQDNVELIGRTTNKAVGEYSPHRPEAPLRLQDHGDRVRFRNIWYRELDDSLD